jgi:cytochrome c2
MHKPLSSSAAIALFVLMNSTAVDAQGIENGRILAERLCARCHMNQDQGEKQGPMGVPGFRAIAHRPGQSVEGVVGWLRSIPKMMPNHHLTQDEMQALAQFIMSLRNH